jgi:hypothetical protein
VIPMKVGTTRLSRVKTNRSMSSFIGSPRGEGERKRRSSEGRPALAYR